MALTAIMPLPAMATYRTIVKVLAFATVLELHHVIIVVEVKSGDLSTACITTFLIASSVGAGSLFLIITSLLSFSLTSVSTYIQYECCCWVDGRTSS